MAGQTEKNPKVFVVSKPVGPPWSDSSKNLVRDLLFTAKNTDFTVLGTPEFSSPSPRVRVEPFFLSAGSYEPAFRQNLRTLVRLLKNDRDVDLYHFFFAPNPLTCAALRLIMKLKNKPSIHTLCSRPKDFLSIKKWLFADRIVALSDEAVDELKKTGVQNATKISPCALLPSADQVRTSESTVWSREKKPGEIWALYSGDYEVTGGHETILEALPAILEAHRSIRFIIACRQKTAGAKAIEDSFKKSVQSKGLEAHFLFLNEVDDMPSLIRACDFTVLPARSLYRKMDIPLVLLESLALEKPVVVSGLHPLRELVVPEVGFVANTPPEFAAAVLTLVKDPDKRRSMGRRGREHVQRNFSAESAAEKYETLYRELLNEKKPASSGRYYDAFSKTYEANRRTGYHHLLDELESSLVKRHAAGKKVLEVGCGTGLIMERVAPVAERLTGIDSSDGMLEKARAKGFDARKGTAESIPFPDESFDVVYSFKVLAHVENIRKALAEMSRVTKPGGFVIAEFYNAQSIRGLRWLVRKKLFYRGQVAGRLTEKDIFTRYDSMEELLSYAPADLERLDIEGAMVWTPFAAVYKLPLVSELLRGLESKAGKGALKRWAGFVTVVYRKKDL